MKRNPVKGEIMVTVIAGIIPEWENRKLFTYLSDRVINMIH